MIQMHLIIVNLFRFWYENPGVFTEPQLAELRKVTMARMICDSGDNIKKMPADVFRNEELEDWMDCEDIEYMDLTPWKY